MLTKNRSQEPPMDFEEGAEGALGQDLPAAQPETSLVVTRTDPALLEAELRTFASLSRDVHRDAERSLQGMVAELELSARLDPGHLKRNNKTGLDEWKDGFADSQYYVIDYGGDKPVTGLSYKASLLMARHWGGLLGTARIVTETDDYIDAEGVAMQFNPIFILRRQRRESKWYRPRGKRELVRIREDQMAQVHGRAQSKALRNAWLGVIPHSVQTVYWNRCKELVAGKGKGMPKVDLKKAIPATLAWLEARGVNREAFERKVGHSADTITHEEWADLRGVLQAIKIGEVSAAQAFGVDEKPEQKPDDFDPTKAQGETES